MLPLLLAGSSHGAVVFQQLPAFASGATAISSTLDFVGGQPGLRTADDFQLTVVTTITDIHWWGMSRAGGNAFTFTFYDSAIDPVGNNVPGNVLLTTTGSLNTSVVDVNPGIGVDLMTFYEADLTTPFAASANTRYWVSIFNSASDASWVWLSANAPGNGSRQGELPVPPWPALLPDMSFQLTNTVVPEVSALALWTSLGVGLIGALSWRKGRQIAVRN
jgi:hypothetical protein